MALGHLHGLHPTLALVRPGPGPDPHPTAPIPAVLPDTARSQAAGPGMSQPAEFLAGTVNIGAWDRSSGHASLQKVAGFLGTCFQNDLGKLYTEEQFGLRCQVGHTAGARSRTTLLSEWQR